MIRPFNLRDLPLVHRLSENGVALHTESALTKNLHPVRGALFSLVGGDFSTYVWKAKAQDQAGFIQLFLEEASHHGRILYLSSTTAQGTDGGQSNGEGRETAVSHPPSDESATWLPLLDQAVVEAGRRGMQSLVAEVSETGVALPMLRHAGFAVYTRQDIWVLDNVNLKENGRILSPRQSKDDWEIQLLYANTVPRLVKVVEPTPPLYNGEGWVLREQNEVTAFVHIHKGAAATWMRLYIHPNAESQIDDILYSALQVRPPSPTHPIYCCVRRYQSWIQTALDQHGFTLWGSQAVMVKHTVHHIPKALPDIRAVIDAQGVTPTTPFVPRYVPSETNGTATHHNA
jgi:hypothetical protein